MNNTYLHILHDNNNPICVIGKSYFNRLITNFLISQNRSVENESLESILEKPQSWFDARQFFFTFGDVGFRNLVWDKLQHAHPNYVTFVDTNASIHNVSNIGRNCVFVGSSVTMDDSLIGNNVVIGPCVISHECKIGDFCHLSPFCYLSFTDLAKGNVAGVGSKFIGRKNKRLHTAPWCNYYVNTLITKNIKVAGTYSGTNNFTSNETSLTKNIL